MGGTVGAPAHWWILSLRAHSGKQPLKNAISINPSVNLDSVACRESSMCSNEESDVAQEQADGWKELTADRGTELTCWEGCPGNKGVCIWQRKYLITRKACAAAAQALLTPWALCLFSHPMMYLLFQDPRSGPSQRVDLRVWSL